MDVTGKICVRVQVPFVGVGLEGRRLDMMGRSREVLISVGLPWRNRRTIGGTSPFFPGILLSSKSSEPQEKQPVVEKKDG